MTIPDFISALKVQTSDAAVRGTIKTLERPAGRRPAARLVEMSNWYLALSDADKAMLRTVLQESAEAAVFNFLCVLDGVSVIEDGPNKGTLQLNYINQNENILISDGQFSSLHDEYNALCQS